MVVCYSSRKRNAWLQEVFHLIHQKLTKRSKLKQTLLNLHNSDRFSGIFYKRNCKICQKADRLRVFSILTKFKDGGRPDYVAYQLDSRNLEIHVKNSIFYGIIPNFIKMNIIYSLLSRSN